MSLILIKPLSLLTVAFSLAKILLELISTLMIRVLNRLAN
jgi:hypothetical protein